MSETFLEYLPPEWPNKPDSGPRVSGQKTCPGRRQFDDTCMPCRYDVRRSGRCDRSSVRQAETRSGRSRRRRFAHLFARFRVVARTVDRFRRCHQGRALLSCLDVNRFATGSTSIPPLRDKECVVIMTADSDGSSRQRKSDCCLRRRTGPKLVA